MSSEKITLNKSIHNDGNWLEAVVMIAEKNMEWIELMNIIALLCKEKRELSIKHATTGNKDLKIS